MRRFSDEQAAELRRMGVTERQLMRLQSRFQLIRDSVFNTRKQDVVDPLTELLKHVRAAESVSTKMACAREGRLWEAYGHLGAGAFDFSPRKVCPNADWENGELPDFVNVPTLLRLITNATERALAHHAPKAARRPSAPKAAIKQIVIAMNDPAWEVKRGINSKFADLCSIVFDAASGGKYRDGEPSIVPGNTSNERRKDIDRAIRAYLERGR